MNFTAYLIHAAFAHAAKSAIWSLKCLSGVAGPHYAPSKARDSGVAKAKRAARKRRNKKGGAPC